MLTDDVDLGIVSVSVVFDEHGLWTKVPPQVRVKKNIVLTPRLSSTVIISAGVSKTSGRRFESDLSLYLMAGTCYSRIPARRVSVAIKCGYQGHVGSLYSGY